MKLSAANGGGRIVRQIKGFFAWWMRGLAAGLPDRVRKPFLGARDELVLEVSGSEAELVRRHGGDRVVLATLGLSDDLDVDLPPIEYSASQLVIELAERHLLRRRLEWPIQAENNLDSALRFQLHKLIPMSVDDVYFRYTTIGRRREKGVIELDLLVIPRKEVDPWLERVSGSRLAGAVRALTVRGVEPEIDFLPDDFSMGRRGISIVPKLMLAAAVVLAVVALLLPIYKKQRELDLVNLEIEKYRQQAEETLELRQETETRLGRATRLMRLVNKMPSRVGLLEELALRLPDSAYATSVTVQGDTVQLEGEAASSTEVIELLAASPQFRNVAFSAPVSKNQVNDTERFRVSFSVVEEKR